MWKLNIMPCINRLEEFPFTINSKVLIAVEIHTELTRFDNDNDNRYVKPIIDGVVSSGLIVDDTGDKVSYLVEYSPSNENYTIINIIPIKSTLKISDLFC
ncbi:hypothetical protein [Clostridium algidicarnis]|uniref:hypothetical protein n=1 Tax=Clostridium algidicarnis TaxID=37659 RepID=UPI001C0D7378|nr:hypothetical protein [Clostridium algidicarnis]MBU3193417.1 hypothetical protein [Clostridium algidicarnis]